MINPIHLNRLNNATYSKAAHRFVRNFNVVFTLGTTEDTSVAHKNMKMKTSALIGF